MNTGNDYLDAMLARDFISLALAGAVAIGAGVVIGIAVLVQWLWRRWKDRV